MTTVTLAGSALKAEATRLAIPGRSKMSADQLRAAVAATLATLENGDPGDLFDIDPVQPDDQGDDLEDITPIGPYFPEEDGGTEDLDDWAGEVARRGMSDRHGTPVPDQRPLPATDDLGPDDWRREVRQILATPPASMTPAVFATRWGKKKRSLNGRTRRTSNR